MKPKPSFKTHQQDMLRPRIEGVAHSNHPLVILSDKIN